MTDRERRTLDVIDEVSRTADRLARRMGGHYVLNGEIRRALEEREREHPVHENRIIA